MNITAGTNYPVKQLENAKNLFIRISCLIPQKIVNSGLAAGFFIHLLNDDRAGQIRAGAAVWQGLSGQSPGNHDGVCGDAAHMDFAARPLDDFR